MTSNGEERHHPNIKKGVPSIQGASVKAKVVSDEEIDLTVDKALEILSLDTFVGERPAKDSHVQYLYDEMMGGRFRPEHVIIALAKCKEDGKLYRINGQHTCWAKSECHASYKIKVRLVTYEVPDQQNLRSLYNTFDPPVASRSFGHMVKAGMAEMPGFTQVWPSSFNKLGAAYRFWKAETKEDRRRFKHHEVVAEMLRHPQLVVRVGVSMQQLHEYSHLMRVPVIAAMFETMDRRPGQFEAFWKPVADGLNLSEQSDPRYRLRQWLQEHTTGSRSVGSIRKPTSSEECYRICISAWNRWRRGDKVTALRKTDRRFRAR